MHVVYDNAEAQTEPVLTVRDMRWIGVDDGYSITRDTYHTILRPEDGTLSLLLRGPKRFARSNISKEFYSLEAFTAEFNAMRRILAAAAASRDPA